MKINKKQAVMLSLSLVLVAAVYLNWRFIHLDRKDAVVEQTSSEIQIEENNENEEKTLGKAQYVSASATSVEEYFTGSRLNRQESKDEALDMLQGIVDNEQSSADSIAKANAEIVSIAKYTELEGTVENLIKAKGFDDCVVFISADVVNVVVHSDGLKPEQAAQITEIVSSQTNMPAQNIKIVEIN